ncbi:Cyclin-dependent kinase 8 [Hondaea fermentalgiana]|uniref:Cyclin-dependent kinase 2 homolog n=1 Tax=Hondaea fermentalgiana TaxID=2315210 RepID=A0A2R5G5Q6_9STRA|nr:Cyclin-dependent kinase 8 [Hondaea fermentalgiana]|eukprot:GBG26366.1 Cyclin-dependent kinase 8 [Hondaea fermentalgiana]
MSPELLARYELEGEIGEGTYGRVYKAKKWKSQSQDEDDTVYAIKMIKRSNDEMDRPSVTSISTLREIKLLRELNHENIVQLTDVVIDPKERDVALVMDFAAWTLDSVLRQHRKIGEKISDYMCKAMMYQMLRGLEYMHRNWVLHRDLKPQNILIIGDGKKRGTLQLADLGLARIFRSPPCPLGKVDKTVVTLWYRSPELLLGAKHYTTAVDIWSLGCIFAELLIAHARNAPPALFAGRQNEEKTANFESDQCKQVFGVFGVPTNDSWPGVESLPHYRSLANLKTSSALGAPTTLMARTAKYAESQPDRGLLDLLTKMLELDPSKRISASAALNHDCFLDFCNKHPEHKRRNALDDPTIAYGQQRKPFTYPRNDPKPLPDSIRDAQAEARNHRASKRPRLY